MGPAIGPPTPASFEGLLTALINDLGAGPAADEALLVLDDYHVIGAPARARFGTVLLERAGT